MSLSLGGSEAGEMQTTLSERSLDTEASSEKVMQLLPSYLGMFIHGIQPPCCEKPKLPCGDVHVEIAGHVSPLGSGSSNLRSATPGDTMYSKYELSPLNLTQTVDQCYK